MSEATSLRRHLIAELRDLLDAEQQLTQALPRYATAAAALPLKKAFQKHLDETERHIDRLNQALAALGETPRAKRCVGMRGLIAEGSEMMGTSPKGALRDAILISGAQKVEHYEMAAYGTARTYAEVLGRSDVARLLNDSLREEKAADQKLTEIAEENVNLHAAEEVHKESSGILDQSAEWVGSTVGTAARTVRRAARAVGLRNLSLGDAVSAAQSVAADVLPKAATKRPRPQAAKRSRKTTTPRAGRKK
jgi:ferritin-like metal-binding protein YciE